MMNYRKMFSGISLAVACAVFAVPALAAECDNCGKVTAIKTVKIKGKGSGGGAVAGGVVGGVVGHQFGSGSGRTAMTILGAAGGAYAGNEIEKDAKSRTVYKVSVNMEFGEMRHYTLNKKPGFSVGDRVRVNEGKPVFYSR